MASDEVHSDLHSKGFDVKRCPKPIFLNLSNKRFDKPCDVFVMRPQTLDKCRGNAPVTLPCDLLEERKRKMEMENGPFAA
jgi:hypothetical protein